MFFWLAYFYTPHLVSCLLFIFTFIFCPTLLIYFFRENFLSLHLCFSVYILIFFDMFFLLMYSLPIFGMSENSVIIEEEKKEKRRYEFVKACKSSGIKAVDSYAALSKRNIFGVTSKLTEYLKFNAKFMNKAMPHHLTVSDFMEQVQIDLVGISNQHVKYKGKVSKCVLSVMDVFSCFCWLYPLQRKFPRHVSTHLFKIF